MKLRNMSKILIINFAKIFHQVAHKKYLRKIRYPLLKPSGAAMLPIPEKDGFARKRKAQEIGSHSRDLVKDIKRPIKYASMRVGKYFCWLFWSSHLPPRERVDIIVVYHAPKTKDPILSAIKQRTKRFTAIIDIGIV